MPHIIVKLYAGKTEEQKQGLATALAKALSESIGSKDESISVAIEDVAPEQWADEVYRPEIVEKESVLYKKPGYNPFA